MHAPTIDIELLKVWNFKLHAYRAAYISLDKNYSIIIICYFNIGYSDRFLCAK